MMSYGWNGRMVAALDLRRVLRCMVYPRTGSSLKARVTETSTLLYGPHRTVRLLTGECPVRAASEAGLDERVSASDVS